MYNRQEQIEIIQSIKVSEGESKTIDCPFCHGKKKFSITNNDGTVLWNCYKASCSIRGAYRKGMTLSLARNKTQKLIKPNNETTRSLPAVLSNPMYHPHMLVYLENNNCIGALENGLVNIKYDPVSNRCLFMMNNDQGAVGRSLGNTKPKWMSYGDTTGLLTVGTSNTGIIVEDAPSACAVSSTGMYTGIAILGTNLSTKQKQTLKTYKKLVICLDNDAKKKSILLLGQLQGLVDCTVRFISKDLKYCRSEDIVNVIEERPGL